MDPTTGMEISGKKLPIFRGHQMTYFWVDQAMPMYANIEGFHINNALFGWVIYKDP